MFLQKEHKDGQEKQVFMISEAHVDGFEIELPHSMRVYFDEDPDIKQVESEPHTFQPDNKKVMALTLNDTPITEIKKVDITVQKTITMTHGSYSGAIDPILQYLRLFKLNKIYDNGTDYKLHSGDVNWSLPGREPAPGSSYQITYRSRNRATPEGLNEQGCKIKGAVDGTLVLVDYSWKMPRYDLITIDSKGIVRRIKGIAHAWRPSIPQAPAGQLALSFIYQKWKKEENPSVINSAIHAVPMNDLEAMKKGINDLYALVAEERLRSDANSREPTAKKGVFVDPFFDDDLRDLGITQTAAIVDKELTLPINVTVVDVEKSTKPQLLPYELEPVLEQLLQTKEMKINPYQAFDPVPAKVTINSSVDHWTEVKTNWLSPITGRFNVNDTIELVNSRSNQIAFMRQATQSFKIEGFSPNEELKELKFDGISIQPTA